jgi:hypothetical protein
VTDTALSATTALGVEIDTGGRALVRGEGDAATWAGAHRAALRAEVTRYGALVVRGLAVQGVDDAIGAFRSLSTNPMSEREGFAPRSRYAEGVYSSSRWPADQPMCMHHELSYADTFPALLALACLRAPETGGATATASAASVLSALPPDLVRRFTERGWLLVRNFTADVGVSLAAAFGTDERDGVETYCRAHGIDWEWQPDGALRTWQRRPAVLRHPMTGIDCWFNQIAFFNEWTMAPDVRDYLVDVYGPDGLPFTTRYGDGTLIEPDIIELINGVYDAHTVSRPWQAGDLMLVDNLGTAHSTQPYQGKRQVLVGLAEPVRGGRRR